MLSSHPFTKQNILEYVRLRFFSHDAFRLERLETLFPIGSRFEIKAENRLFATEKPAFENGGSLERFSLMPGNHLPKGEEGRFLALNGDGQGLS